MPAKLMEMTWFRFLEELSVAKYKKLNLTDYIKHTRNSFLPSEIQECISRLENIDLEPDFLADLHILAFVYRHLGSVFCDKVNFLFKDSGTPTKPCPLNNNASTFHEKIKELPSVACYQKIGLKDEARLIREKMKQYVAKAVRRQRNNRKNKREDFFREILKESQKKGIDDIIRAKTHDEKEFQAVRRGYFRWKKENYDLEDTDALLHFRTLLSISYESDSRMQNYYYLRECASFEGNNYIDSCLCHIAQRQETDNLRKTKLAQLKKMQDAKKRIDGLKALARLNYSDAIHELIKQGSLSPDERKKYLLQLAILGDLDSAKRIGWKASGFNNLPIEICVNNTGLRTRQLIISPFSGGSVEKHMVLREISFHIDVSQEIWKSFRRALRGYHIFDPDIFLLTKPGQKYKKVEVDATPYNLNLIMKNADKLYSAFEISFKTQGKKGVADLKFERILEMMDQG